MFDTLLTRCVWVPSDLFLLLGRRLQQKGLVSSPEQFQEARMTAEREARAAGPGEDTDLKRIYARLAEALDWTEDVARRVAEEELRCEEDALTLLASGCRTVKSALDSEARTICVSDIYLPPDFVAKQLESRLSIRNIKLYTSSGTGFTKHSGHLYVHIAEQESVGFAEWRHWGDNPHSDVRVPRQLGIDARLTENISSTRYESHLARQPSTLLARTLAGCMRATRLSENLESVQHQALWDLGCDIVGPAFFGYCYWLLHTARRDGIRRLYFVARDGQILWRIATAIQEAVPVFSGIECRYLYGSRQAWHLPSVSQVDGAVLDWLFDSTSYLSVKVVLKRLGAEEADVPPSVRELVCTVFPHAMWEDNLSASQRSRLRALFGRNEIITKWISLLAERSRENATGYLRQEGLLEDIPWAIVDIGWRGRLQNSLSSILRLALRDRWRGVRAYYWGLSGKVPAQPEDRQATFADELPGMWHRTLFYNSALYEIFAAADHGSTVAYRENNGRWDPVLRSDDAGAWETWGGRWLQDASLTFVRNFLRNWRDPLDVKQYMCLVLPLLRTLFLHPSCGEVACLEAKPLYECQTEAVLLPLAPKELGWPLLKSWLFGARVEAHGIWPHGIVSKQPWLLRALLAAAFGWRRGLGGCRRCVKRALLAFRGSVGCG